MQNKFDSHPELSALDQLEHKAITIDQAVILGELFPLGAEACLKGKVIRAGLNAFLIHQSDPLVALLWQILAAEGHREALPGIQMHNQQQVPSRSELNARMEVFLLTSQNPPVTWDCVMGLTKLG